MCIGMATEPPAARSALLAGRKPERMSFRSMPAAYRFRLKAAIPAMRAIFGRMFAGKG